MPMYNSLALSVGRTGNLLLTDGIWQTWWAINPWLCNLMGQRWRHLTGVIKVLAHLIFIKKELYKVGLTQTDELLNEGLEVRDRSSQRHSTGLEKANCNVMERVTWQKSVLASRSWGPQSYNCKGLNSANSQWPKAENPANSYLVSWYMEIVKWYICVMLSC